MQVTLRVNDTEVQRFFEEALQRTGNLLPANEEIGALGLRSIMKNFAAQGRYSEAGSWKGGSNRWAPLSAGTLAARNFRWTVRKNKEGKVTSQGFKKRRNPNTTILIATARLRNSITYEAGTDRITWGTNVVYAGIQNFGGKTKPHTIRARNKLALSWPGGPGPRKSVKHPGSKIPARPFLVLQDEDIVQIKNVLMQYVAGRAAST